MKKFIVVLAFFFLAWGINAQTFDSVSAVRKYVDDSIRRKPDKINAMTLNKAYVGIIDFLPQSVDNLSSVTNPKHGYLYYQRKDGNAYIYDKYSTPSRWREYVAPITGSNGIVMDGRQAILGGALNRNTEINLDTYNFSLLGNGRIGIGETSPLYPIDIRKAVSIGAPILHLAGSSVDNGLYFSSTAAGVASISANAVMQSGLLFARSQYANVISLNSGNFLFFSNDNLVPGNMFEPSLKMVIGANGNVGIGITSSSKSYYPVTIGNRMGSQIGVSPDFNDYGLFLTAMSPTQAAISTSKYTPAGEWQATHNNSSIFELGSSGFSWSSNNGLSIGSNFSPTQIMTLSSSGLLSVGTARIMGSTGTPTTIAGRNGSGDISSLTLGNGLKLVSGELRVEHRLVKPGDANYSVAHEDGTILYTTVTATRTITLPSASAYTNRTITLVNGTNNAPGANDLQITPAVRKTAAATVNSLQGQQRLVLQSDGTDWWILN